jgi:hypothetical protein
MAKMRAGYTTSAGAPRHRSPARPGTGRGRCLPLAASAARSFRANLVVSQDFSSRDGVGKLQLPTRMRNGGPNVVEVQVHPDPRCQAMLEQVPGSGLRWSLREVVP